MDLVYVGKIVNTHGIKGELRIRSDFEKKELVFIPGNKIIIDKEEHTIRTYRYHKVFDMITIDDYDNINDVLCFVGKKVYVSRDELNSAGECMYNADPNGMCEDVDSYPLRLYGYGNSIDTLSYRPVQETLAATATVNEYYYGMYFNYNPNYFIVVIGTDSKAVTATNLREGVDQTSTARDDTTQSVLLKSTATLTINKKTVAIYVNTHFMY